MQISQQEAVGNSLQGSVSSSPVIFVGGFCGGESRVQRINSSEQKRIGKRLCCSIQANSICVDETGATLNTECKVMESSASGN